MIGVVGARDLRRMASYLVIASVGTMLAAIAMFSEEAVGAGLFYLVHSTIVVAALFLLIELIAEQRGVRGDTLTPSGAVAHPTILGTLYFFVAASVAGLPPFSGFLGKVAILRSGLGFSGAIWLYAVVLTGGLLVHIAVGRAGSLLFWRAEGERSPRPDRRPRYFPVLFLTWLLAAVTLLAGPISSYTSQTASQLMNPDGYIRAVLDQEPIAP
jgi:multicomponent K+:H+ antiporter subunit D